MDKEKILSELDVGNVFKEKIENPVYLDFTSDNQELSEIDLNSEDFDSYIENKTKGAVGIGKYDENRTIYNRSPLFAEDGRSIHLGIDLFVPSGWEIYSILSGKIHSFQENSSFGDYGPTIILEHEENGLKFYTLYGHLSRDSLSGLKKGQEIKKGQLLAKIGSHDVNGSWPPHLHFEIIFDMMGKEGDFPGVTNEKEREFYLKNCPNPNLLLRL